MRAASGQVALLRSGARRYDRVAWVLHWTGTALILTTLLIAAWFETVGADRGLLIRIHKSLGITILIHSGLRLAWRVLNPPPPLRPSPATRLAGAVHGLIYVLLVVLPISGWAMISLATPLRETRIWNLFVLPPLSGLSDLAASVKTDAHQLAGIGHLALGLGLAALLVLHVAGAIRHGARSGD